MALGKIKADTLEHSTAGSLDTQYVVNGSAKAWANNSNSTVIRDSLNVASGTDVAAANYQINLTNNTSSTNCAYSYTANGTSSNEVQPFKTDSGSRQFSNIRAQTTSSYGCQPNGDDASGTQECNANFSVLHGDLA
tara:strand:- start:2617 stop:3024 length:408 start_codon:yes stop_codon:yes gene_type:complete